MSTKESTTAKAIEHEGDIVTLFEWDKALRSKSSGASFHDPVDVTTDSMVIECEYTEAKSYRLSLDFWHEVQQKQHTGKIPALAIRLRDPIHGKHVDLIVMDAHDVSEERETLEALRTQAAHRD